MPQDEDTQPSARVDPRAEMPEQPPTIQLDAVQVLSQLIRGVAADVKASREEVTASFVKVDERLTSQDRKLDKVVTEGIEANVRMTRFEDRLEKLEKLPSTPPLNSTGVKALIDGHPSQMDLTLQAAQAAEIVKNAERDRKIEETHARVEQAATKEDLRIQVKSLADAAATKDDVKALAAETATKAEVAVLLKENTPDIVTAIERLAERNKTVRNLLIGLAGLAFLAMNAATMYLMRAQPQPQQPSQNTTTITVPK